jgi:serine phosphatase RsbU (regulator of sigma subunit)/CBS domain-containing protein
MIALVRWDKSAQELFIRNTQLSCPAYNNSFDGLRTLAGFDMRISRELTVRQVMEAHPAKVGPDCPVQDVLAIMTAKRIGSVLVVTNGDRLAGIFTERDLLKRVTTAAPGWREFPVSAWMTTDPYTICPDANWDEAVGLMSRLRVRHLPVIEDGRVIGIISSRMLMAYREEYLNRVIEERTRELRHANDQLLARDAEVMHNLRAAGRLQTRLFLPSAPPEWPETRWAIQFLPLDHLGGDYYDFAQPDANHLGVLIADASGHSISAAMVAIMARFAFAEGSRSAIEPGEVLDVMNRRLEELTDEQFVTAFYAVYDRRTRKLRYANAGHPYPLLFEAKSQTVRPLAASGFLLGVMPGEVYISREVSLAPGDRVCFYTDGLVEARNEIGEMFGEARLTECLVRSGRGSAQEILDHILNTRKSFSGSARLTDDLTLVILEITT